MSGYEDELLAAVERLYSTFNRYPPRMTVDGCPHCVSSADNDCIHAAPLRQLTETQLERYAFKAITTWGTVDDFRHFLPRIFELLATAPHDWVDPEVVFGKLPYCDFRSWPIAEQQVIEWMASSDRLKELEAAFFAFSSDPAVAGILSEAFNNLYNFRTSIEQGSI